LLKRPGDPDFYRVLSLLKEMQASDSFGMRVDLTKGGASTILAFRAQHVGEAELANAKKVRELLHLSPDAEEFKLTFAALPQDAFLFLQTGPKGSVCGRSLPQLLVLGRRQRSILETWTWFSDDGVYFARIWNHRHATRTHDF
jgi:hypothetical protein